MTQYRVVYCEPLYTIVRGIDKDWLVPAVIYHSKSLSNSACNSCFQMFFAPNSWDMVL